MNAATVVHGSADAFAQWFTQPQPIRPLTGTPDEDVRDEILNDLYNFTAFGVAADDVVIIRTAVGRAIVEPHPQHPEQVVTFTYCRHDRWGLVSFWMNRSSVRGLGDLMRAAPEKRGDFTTIMANA